MRKQVAVNAKAEPGSAQVQYYTPSQTEEFGLNKRTRRLKAGRKDVTTPDGKLIEN
jgi:hypothetical protein